MVCFSAPFAAKEVIFQDAFQRDLLTARRALLLETLWRERYLTRAQLIVRVEGRLGRGCFGASAWADAFYRDLRVVKQALNAAGFQLQYSRNAQRPGYYLKNQPTISEELADILRNTAAEVDPNQIAVLRRLSPAQRFQLGCSVSDAARQVVAYRIRQQQPELTPSQANFLAVQKGQGLSHKSHE